MIKFKSVAHNDPMRGLLQEQLAGLTARYKGMVLQASADRDQKHSHHQGENGGVGVRPATYKALLAVKAETEHVETGSEMSRLKRQNAEQEDRLQRLEIAFRAGHTEEVGQLVQDVKEHTIAANATEDVVESDVSESDLAPEAAVAAYTAAPAAAKVVQTSLLGDMAGFLEGAVDGNATVAPEPTVIDDATADEGTNTTDLAAEVAAVVATTTEVVSAFAPDYVSTPLEQAVKYEQARVKQVQAQARLNHQKANVDQVSSRSKV